MKKGMYSLFKEIIPNFLLSILFILLFDVLNYKVEIANSIYVIYFSLLFMVLNYIISIIIKFFEFQKIRKLTITDFIYSKGNSLIYFFLVFKIINMVVSIALFYLLSFYYSDYIVINSFYIPLIIGLMIEIFKIILNKTFKFDKIMLQGANQKEIDEELDNLINSIIQNTSTHEETKEEKSNKSKKDIEKIMKRSHDPIEKEEDDE